MKIRHGFVTNSSSSSFILLKYKSAKLCEIAELFTMVDGFFGDLGYGYRLFDGEIIYTEEDWPDWEMPNNKEEALNCLLYTLAYGCGIDEDIEIHPNEELNTQDRLAKFNEIDLPVKARMAIEISRHYKEILDDIECMQVNVSDHGWGGDDDSRFNKDCYSDETLEDIYKNIADSKGIKVEEVTDDDFDDYVGDKTSIAESDFIYQRIDGKELIEQTDNYYLE